MQTVYFQGFRSPRFFVYCLYVQLHKETQHFNLPDQYSITLRITRPWVMKGWEGNQSLPLGVFVRKINVSSGIKIDDNLYLSRFQEPLGAGDATTRPKPYAVSAPLWQTNSSATWRSQLVEYIFYIYMFGFEPTHSSRVNCIH